MLILLAVRSSLVVASVVACAAVAAGCRLPVPDGSGVRPTVANLEGRIASVNRRDVVVLQATTGRLVKVRLPQPAEIYSAFGGDASLTDLAKGQTVSVWFENCKWPRSGTPVSAYFQIYSKDPHDRP